MLSDRFNIYSPSSTLHRHRMGARKTRRVIMNSGLDPQNARRLPTRVSKACLRCRRHKSRVDEPAQLTTKWLTGSFSVTLTDPALSVCAPTQLANRRHLMGIRQIGSRETGLEIQANSRGHIHNGKQRITLSEVGSILSPMKKATP